MKALKWINLGAFLAMVAVNALANLLPLNGKTTGQVSREYENLFTPAPFTFFIWAVIYVCIALFIIYQLGLTDAGDHSSKIRDGIGFWFTISCLLNIGWIFCWHYNAIGLSVAFIAALLVSLIIIEKKVSVSEAAPFSKLMVRAGFDIYFGWIIAATIANISAWLTAIKWDGFGLSDEFWTVVVILIGSLIGAATILVEHKWLTGLTIMWAYSGILIKHIAVSGYNSSYPFVIASAIVGIVLILSSILLQLMEKHYRGNQDCEKAK